MKYEGIVPGERDSTKKTNEGKSVASFCHQVAACFPDMFSNYCIVNNHKIAKNSTTTNAIEKISTNLEYLEFKEFFKCMLDKIKKQSNFA
jgi:hypothetical protein